MRHFFALFVMLLASSAAAQPYWGNFPDGATLPFWTNTIGSDGAPATPADETVGCIKDGTGADIGGVTIDDDAFVAGQHSISVDTTDSDYTAGSLYTIYYTAGTVDSVSIVGRVIGSFYLGPKDANVAQVGGSAQSMTDLKDFADAGYDPDTDKVQGVVLTDATTTVSNRVTADVDRVDGAALDTHDAGAFPADVRSIQGNATSASNLNELTDGDATGAPLQITELAVTEGATISTTDSGEPALTLAGNGGGLVINAGSAGTGVTITGGTSGGFGVELTTTDGHGVIVSAGGNNATGVSINGGTGLAPVGLKISGGAGLAPVDIDADILGSITGDLIGNVSGSTDSVTSPVIVGTNNDKTGYSLSQAGLADFFDTNTALTFANAVSGSVVKEIADHATTPSLTAGGIADAVLDEPLSGHPTTGSLGAVVADIFEFLDGAPTFAEAMDGHGYTTDRAEKIDRLAPSLLLSTTIDDSTPTQTSFEVAVGPPDDDALNGALVIVTHGTQKAVGLVKDYDGSTQAITLVTDPGIFTFADGDQVDVIATGTALPLWLSGP